MPVKRIIITVIALTTAGLHLVTGPDYAGPLPLFVNGYLIDVLLPMTFFLLSGLFQAPVISNLYFRLIGVWTGCAFVEAAQYFGYPLFGSTFDWFDLVAYGSGVMLGLLIERYLLTRLPTADQLTHDSERD